MDTALVGSIILWLIVAIIGIVVVVYLLHWLYHRSTKEVAFVRTGFGGEKVIINGGALVLPIIHEVTPVNLNVVRIPVERTEQEAVITRDRMRVDIEAEFFVRVIQKKEAVAAAASTLGRRTMDPERLADLLTGKFVGALRSVSAEMTLDEMHEKRSDLVTMVEERAAEALARNGLELESVAITDLDQTNLEFFNPANRFDAEGMTQLIETIEARRKLRNDVEQTSMVAIRARNLEAEKETLKIDQESESSRLAQERDLESMRAEQRAELTRIQAVREAEAHQARIASEQETREREIARQRALDSAEIKAHEEIEQARIVQEQALEKARIERDRAIRQQQIQQRQDVEQAEIATNEELERARVISEKQLREARITAEEENQNREIARDQLIETARIKQEEELEKARLERESAIRRQRVQQRHDLENVEISANEDIERAKIVSERQLREARIVSEEETQSRDIVREQQVEAARIAARKALETARIQQDQAIDKVRIERDRHLRSQEIALRQATEEAEISAREELERARIASDRGLDEARILKERDLKRLEIERSQALELAEIERQIIVLQKQSEEAGTRVETEEARARAVKAEENVSTTRETVIAERVAAVDRLLAQKNADTAKIAAEADKISAAVAAEAQRLRNEAENILSEDARAAQLRAKMIDRLEGIVRESVRPMENIEGIKILHVDGLTGGGGGGHRSPTDEVIESALRYRAQAPLIDEMMKEIGVENPNVARMGDLFRSAKDAQSLAKGNTKKEDD
jgi:uncharacterized membrane protein YqiK